MVVEMWLLWGLAALQIAVSRWWWKGPALEGTRGWGSGLFALTGVSTFFRGLWIATGQPDGDPFYGIRWTVDRWSDLFLLGVALAGSGWEPSESRIGRAVTGFAVAGLIVATPQFFIPEASLGSAVDGFGQELPLLLATAVTAVALVRYKDEMGAASAWPWALVLSVMGLRFAEVSTFHWSDEIFNARLSEGLLPFAHGIAQSLAFLSVLVSFLVLASSRLSADDPRRRTQLEVAMGLLLAGIVFGVAQKGAISGVPALMYMVTLSLVRPVGFLVAQSQLDGRGFFGSPRWRYVGGAAGVFLFSVFGLVLGQEVWGLQEDVSILVALTGLILASPLAAAAYRRVPEREGDRGNTSLAARSSEPSEARFEWPVEEDRVSLPDDWREQLEKAYEKYRGVPPATRDELADLARWERILLYLDGLEEDDVPPDAYERTTPGLHLATHCPYSNIGPEVGRANERSESILSALGLDQASEQVLLIENTWGRAQGLDSPRVKMYEITPLGRIVARRLRREKGIDVLSPEELTPLLAEGFC